MKLDKSVRAELWYVAAGLIVCGAVLCAVYALIGKFDYTVPLGALWGSVFAFLRMYLLARRVQAVAACGEAEKELAQKRLRSSYFIRMLILVAAVVAGIALPFLNYIAALVPFLVPQPVMMLRKAIVSRRAQKEADHG